MTLVFVLALPLSLYTWGHWGPGRRNRPRAHQDREIGTMSGASWVCVNNTEILSKQAHPYQAIHRPAVCQALGEKAKANFCARLFSSVGLTSSGVGISRVLWSVALSLPASFLVGGSEHRPSLAA